MPPFGGGEAFHSTHWTTVFMAGKEHEPEARQALDRLCANYWFPLYAYVRRQGHAIADAQDLTQEFLARFVERKYVQLADPKRGRFRTFLLTSLKHFLINEWRKGQAQVRGGGLKIVSLDEQLAEENFAAEPMTDQEPDTTYDQRWGTTLRDVALKQLGEELARSGKAEAFDQLRGFVSGGDDTTRYAAVAERLNMTVPALKVEVHRLRRRYGQKLRDEVKRTVATPADIDEELRYLIAVLRARG